MKLLCLSVVTSEKKNTQVPECECALNYILAFNVKGINSTAIIVADLFSAGNIFSPL